MGVLYIPNLMGGINIRVKSQEGHLADFKNLAFIFLTDVNQREYDKNL